MFNKIIIAFCISMIFLSFLLGCGDADFAKSQEMTPEQIKVYPAIVEEK